MGWKLFIAIEVIYMIFFILIVVFATISLSDAKDGKKNSPSGSEDEDNYNKADTWLGICIGIGYTLIVLGIIAMAIVIVAVILAGPEEAVAAGATEAAEGLALEAGESTIMGDLLEFAKAFDKAEFNKFEDVARFARTHRKTAKELLKKTDEAYAHLKHQSDGLLYYNRIFGMSGIKGTIEKIILWSSAFLLFCLSICAAIAAGYIGRTTEKRGYEYAITTAIIGIIPFSIMVIWGLSNWFYTRSELKKAIQSTDEAAVIKESENVTRKPKSVKKKRVSAKNKRRTPPPAKDNERNYNKRPPAKDSDYYNKSTQTAKQLMSHAEQAHKLLSSVSGSVDPNSSSGQLLGSVKNALGSALQYKDQVDKL